MSYNNTTRTRETVYDEKAADMAMAQLEALDCGTLLSMLARIHKLVAKKTRHHLRRCGAALPIYAAGKQIPSEAMFKVFDWLDYDSVRECRLVSRSFYAVLCDQRLWTEIPDVAYGTGGRLDRATVDLSKTIKVARHYPRLQRWYIPRELDFHAASSDVLDGIGEAMPNVRMIAIHADNTTPTPEQMAQLLTRMPRTRSLAVGFGTVPGDLASLTRLTVGRTGSEYGQLPLLQSTSLRHLDYGGHDIAGSLNELLTGCPNLATVLGSSSVHAPLVSASLRTLLVHTIAHADAFQHCPVLTEVRYRAMSRHAASDVWSDTVEVLTGTITNAISEADLHLFPRLQSYSVTSIVVPITSDSLRRLALDEQLALPIGSAANRLQWLSVCEGKRSGLVPRPHTPSTRPLPHISSCNWPTTLQTLRITFNNRPPNSPVYTQFVKDALARLPRLTELQVSAVLLDSVYSDTLTQLGVYGFHSEAHLVTTVDRCTNLKVVRFKGTASGNHTPTSWLRDLYWELLDDGLSSSGLHKRVTITVPAQCCTSMPPRFKKMLVEGRAAYDHSVRHSSAEDEDGFERRG